MFKNHRLHLGSALILSAGLLLLGAPTPAAAGCGCDHPPPAWEPIMPSFASPGKEIRIFADGATFTVGASYDVQFIHKDNVGPTAVAVAQEPDSIRVVVPDGIKPGAQELRVMGPGMDHIYSWDLFTGLAPALEILATPGSFREVGFKTAKTSDGTLLIPIDLSAVQDPMQLAFQFENKALTFSADDVVFYNADGVDLTLFTLVVENDQERQWGSYFGWNVEEDTGLMGDTFEKKVKTSRKLDELSDLLTYWRHEFYTYEAAHSPGGTHEVDADGLHPDGTLHIDHDHLVLAISGALERDKSNPEDLSLAKPLKVGGELKSDFLVLTVLAENPIEPETMDSIAETSEPGDL